MTVLSAGLRYLMTCLFVCLFSAVSGSEEQQLMLQWFKLVNRKNALIRYESELVIQ